MSVRRILVVDDCVDTVETVSALYSILGFECRGASTGAEAIEEAVEFDPEVVLLDLGLPDVSGYEVARALRERCPRGIYLAAFTGWGGVRIQERAREVGFDQHVLKPIGKEALFRIVQRASRMQRRAQPVHRSAASESDQSSTTRALAAIGTEASSATTDTMLTSAPLQVAAKLA